MPDKIFFQCSLPRVGSTMFQNLMNQDEKIYASGNNGLLNLVNAAKNNYVELAEFKAQDAEVMKAAFQGFCNGSIHGFYNAITDRKYILDKSRGNFGNYSFVDEFYPDPKIICFVRNMPDIFASMEKLFRKNPYKSNAMVNHAIMQGTTTPKRADLLHQSFVPSMNQLSNAVRQGLDKKMLFIKYESFCLQPEIEMKRVYEYLGIPLFKHRFDQIDQTIREDEHAYQFSYAGLLKIRPKLEMKPSDAKDVLGKDVCDWIMNTYKWYNDYFGYK